MSLANNIASLPSLQQQLDEKQQQVVALRAALQEQQSALDSLHNMNEGPLYLNGETVSLPMPPGADMDPSSSDFLLYDPESGLEISSQAYKNLYFDSYRVSQKSQKEADSTSLNAFNANISWPDGTYMTYTDTVKQNSTLFDQINTNNQTFSSDDAIINNETERLTVLKMLSMVLFIFYYLVLLAMLYFLWNRPFSLYWKLAITVILLAYPFFILVKDQLFYLFYKAVLMKSIPLDNLPFYTPPS